MDKCTECYACFRSSICPTDAIKESALVWPRSLRPFFGSVQIEHKETRVPGRGTEEMKTNDVTGRFGYDKIGFSVDIGRPGVGTTFDDVEKIAMAVAKTGAEFEPMNPVTFFMADKKTGRIRDDVKTEKIHSCVLEFTIRLDRLPKAVNALAEVSKEVDTVFSVGCCCKVSPDGTILGKRILEENSIFHRPNGKTNVGLGKPHAEIR